MGAEVASYIEEVACHQNELVIFQMALQTEKMYFQLIVHVIADTDTDENCFGINFSCRHSCSLKFRWGGGRIADRNSVGNISVS